MVFGVLKGCQVLTLFFFPVQKSVSSLHSLISNDPLDRTALGRVLHKHWIFDTSQKLTLSSGQNWEVGANAGNPSHLGGVLS